MTDIKNAIMHLKTHQDYPATKAELIAACQELKDFSAEDKKWFMENLPDGTYKSAEEVIKAFGWQDKMSSSGGKMDDSQESFIQR